MRRSLSAELALADDGKVTLVNGVPAMPAAVKPDTIAILDLAASPPKVEMRDAGSVPLKASPVGMRVHGAP